MGGWRKRWFYWFDNTMARGTLALIGWLAVICVIADIPISAILLRYDKHLKPTLANHLTAMWQYIGSTFKVGGQLGPPGYVLTSVAGAVIALLFASTLVSLITAGVNKKIMDLRKGRSHVLETGHVVVVGWSDDVFGVVSELRASAARHGRRVLAILADRDKAGMEDEIRARTRDSRIICRSGSPVVPSDIDRMNPEQAQCLIVLAPPGDDADEQVIKTILAIRARSASRVVAAIGCHGNMAAARKAGGDGVQLLDVDDLTGRWIAQTALQPGLSLVFTDLLRFDGNEFCAVSLPELAGRTFGEVLHAFPASSPVGLGRRDGTLMLNPPSETVLGDGDRVIAISRQDAFRADAAPDIDESAIAAPVHRRRVPQRILILGWNRRAPRILRQLDSYVPASSRLDVMAQDGAGRALEKLRADLSHAEVTFRNGDTTDFDMLSALDLAGYQHIIVLSSGDVADRHADFRSLVTLLHLRDLEAALGQRIGIVGEIADDHTRALAPVSEGDDFIVSRTMVSRLMTQVASNPDIVPVFTELFDPEGNEIALRPAPDYVLSGRPVTFATVVEAARRQGQVAIGYRLGSEHLAAPEYGVHLNPDRRNIISLGKADDVIVIAGG
jgi:Trk K+ transport system NAD-binding subunit